MDLSLTLHQIIALLRNARLVIVAVVPNFIVVPLLAAGIDYGKQAFAAVNQPVCYYWIHETERKAKVRKGTVDGMPVRGYFRIRYGAVPQ